jgi:hypothetical protein
MLDFTYIILSFFIPLLESWFGLIFAHQLLLSIVNCDQIILILMFLHVSLMVRL